MMKSASARNLRAAERLRETWVSLTVDSHATC
jgi:hypothetical protein